MTAYSTLLEALNDLATRGYKNSYVLTDKGLYCPLCNQTFTKDQVKVVETHRFEGDSDSEELAILYVLETNGSKGVIIDAYGTYASTDLGDFLK
mgnify:CR=1 FL=1